MDVFSSKSIIFSKKIRKILFPFYNKSIGVKTRILYFKGGTKFMKQFIFKACIALSTLALFVTTSSVNATCIFNMHQPELPVGAEKLSKLN